MIALACLPRYLSVNHPAGIGGPATIRALAGLCSTPHMVKPWAYVKVSCAVLDAKTHPIFISDSELLGDPEAYLSRYSVHTGQCHITTPERDLPQGSGVLERPRCNLMIHIRRYCHLFCNNKEFLVASEA